MICISIAQESRRLALADMLNAARLGGDLLEVRLDCFEKAPDVGELLAVKPRPVIMSCRRVQDGGRWQGTEADRLALLRQCLVSRADYVEIELDVADQIRPFPPAQRVISYTNLRETPDHLADIYAEAQTKRADVVKLVTLVRTPEEAWPLVQILAKPALPTVVVGLGKLGVMLNLLGKKVGAPWTYAALERGMEAYPGQATISDLKQVYHLDAVGRSTRFFGVAGLTELEFVSIAVLNAALAQLGLPARCLPLAVGSLPLFRKVMAAVKLAGVAVDADHREEMLTLADEREPLAERAGAVDLLLARDNRWHGYHTLSRAALAALEAKLRERYPGDRPLHGRIVVVVGTSGLARAVAYIVTKRGGLPVIASRDKAAALTLAQELACRHAQYEAVYNLTHEVLIVCDEEKIETATRTLDAGLHSGYLKPGITVMDLTALPRRSPLLRDAEARGCPVVAPTDVLLNQLTMQIQLLTGKELPRDRLAEVLTAALGEE
jgi:3-dehydroquinate dehydratase/shikimate dehydrogenase